MSVYVFSWEVTTHRAIDQTAILNGQATNFYNFLNDSGLGSQTFDDRNSIMFDTYGVTYFYYIRKGEEGGMSDWNLTFNASPTPIDLIEAGTILEDAVWAGGLFSGDGRFNNHFYDPQKGKRGHKRGQVMLMLLNPFFAILLQRSPHGKKTTY